MQTTWALFVTAHPFTRIFSFSIFISASMQSILLASTLLGAAALAAVFFSGVGDVLSIASPAECETEHTFWRNAAVGILSGLATSIPMVFVAAAMRRHFVLRECWDEAARWRQLRRWRRKDCSIWALCLLYNCLCALFIATFLANIRPQDAQKWLESLLVILMEDFLLQPMLVAIIHTLVTTAIVARNPGLVEEVRNDLHIVDDSATLEATTPLSVSIAAASWLLNMRSKRGSSKTSASKAPQSVSTAVASWSLDMRSKRRNPVLMTTATQPTALGAESCFLGLHTYFSRPHPISPKELRR